MSRRAPLRWYIRFGDPRKVEGGVSVVHDPEAYAYAEEPALRAFEPGDTPPSLRSEAGISAYDVLARGRERIVFHVPVGLWTFSGQMENFLEKRVMDDDVWLFRGRAKAAWGTDGEPLVDASTVRDVRRVGTKHLWVTERKEHTTPSPSWKRMLDLFTAWELERFHDMGYNEFFRKKPKDVSRKEITDYIGALRARFITPEQVRALDNVETLWLQQWDEVHRATARANPRRRNPRNPQTDTPTGSAAFRRWFGDSKVVDARGEPLVVYHGSPKRFDTFVRPDIAAILKDGYADEDEQNQGMGIYFTDSADNAATYGREVYPVYLRMLNPLIVDAQGENWSYVPFKGSFYYADDIVSVAEGKGHDGVVFLNIYDSKSANGILSNTYIVFDPKQIKSATGNRGTFDPADPDIRHNPRRAYTSAMRTHPELWEEVKAEVTRGSKGGLPGQWSARKAQLAVALYKARGGDYYGPKSPYNALAKWTREDWRTKSGRPSLETGERYLPAAAIAALTPAEYAATTKAKRAGMKKGQQFVPQPETVAKKVRRYRRNPAQGYVFYHGAQRWEGPPQIVAHRKGHAEHGPGIYLTTAWQTAVKYAKGGGAVYRIELSPETRWLEGARLPLAETVAWVRGLPRLRGKSDIVDTLSRTADRTGRDTLPAFVLVNAFVNRDVASGQHGPSLAAYLVAHGIDASLVQQGAEDWVVVFNPGIVRSVRRVSAAEVSAEGFAFDLPKVRA